MRPRTISLSAVFVSLAVAGCGGQAATTTEPADGASAQGGAIDVALTEWAVEPAVGGTKSGEVTFNAVNDGDVVHELVVLDTDTPAADLPVEGAEAQEEGELAEVEDIEGGASKPLTVELKPGHYALICNLPGHYADGMYADFEVD